MCTRNLFDWKKRVVKIFHSTCFFLIATVVFPCHTARAQENSATLTLTPIFANNTVTVTVNGTYDNGDTLFYTFNGESPSFSDSYVLLSNPVIPVGTVGTTLAVSLGQRTDESESWSSDATTLELARYAAPEVSYNYANDSFSVGNVSQLVNETTETLTLFLNGEATTDSTFSIGSSYGSTAIDYYSTYSLHLDGNNRFPSHQPLSSACGNELPSPHHHRCRYPVDRPVCLQQRHSILCQLQPLCRQQPSRPIALQRQHLRRGVEQLHLILYSPIRLQGRGRSPRRNYQPST